MKKEEKIKQKRGGSGVGDTIKMNVGSWIKIESRCEALWWGKKAMINLHDINYGR